MKTHRLALLLVVLVSTLESPFASSAQSVDVKTERGLVSGRTVGSVAVFKGIPFAAPPIGDLRWRAPEPPKSWSGVLKCESWPASAMQSKPGPFMMWTEEFIAPPEPLSEDCLYLNLWSTAPSADKKKSGNRLDTWRRLYRRRRF